MGGATFSRWKGIQVLKNKATVVANPKTPAQTAQRSAFTQIVTIFRQSPVLIRTGFKKLAIKQSEFNAFASYNLKNAFDLSAPPVATLNAAALSLGQGTMEPTPILTMVADKSDQSITITYNAIAGGLGQSLEDRANIAVFNTTLGEWINEVWLGSRSEGSIGAGLPASWVVGDVLRAYLSFNNATTGESSNSTTETATVIA
jgi:hypothetical protein